MRYGRCEPCLEFRWFLFILVTFLLVIFVKLQIKGWSLTGGSFIQLSFCCGFFLRV